VNQADTGAGMNDTTVLPDMARLFMAQSDPQRLLQAFLEAAAWASSEDAVRRPIQRAQIAEELDRLVRLEREIRALKGATAVRWDGRSSAFHQADLVAKEDWATWIRSLHRLADLMDELRQPA
jgi:hypothetical protein